MRATKKFKGTYYKCTYTKLELSSITSENGWIATSSGTIGAYDFFQGNDYAPRNESRPLPTFTLINYNNAFIINSMNVKISGWGSGCYSYDLYKNNEFIQNVAVKSTTSQSEGVDEIVTLNNPLVINKGDVFKVVCKAYTSPTYWTSFSVQYDIDIQGAITSTPGDYDFYKDVPVYKLPKIENKYYGINQ